MIYIYDTIIIQRLWPLDEKRLLQQVFSAFDTVFNSRSSSYELISHIDIVHAHLGKVFKHNIIIVVLVIALHAAMLLNRLHFLHRIRALLLNGA